MCLQPQISQPKLGQIGHVGGVLKTSGPADSKSVPGFNNWPRFVGVIEENKIWNSYKTTVKWMTKLRQTFVTNMCNKHAWQTWRMERGDL